VRVPKELSLFEERQRVMTAFGWFDGADRQRNVAVNGPILLCGRRA
jgi:hypothetical protein